MHSSVVVVVANSKAEGDLFEPELRLERAGLVRTSPEGAFREGNRVIVDQEEEEVEAGAEGKPEPL